MRRFMKAAVVAALTITAVLVAWIVMPGSRAGYLVRQGIYGVDYLWGREPIEEVLASGELGEKRTERLSLVPEIKEYGVTIGLSASDSYSVVNPTWKRTVWNVSACEPLRFRSVSWWFPIVGNIPYLGYFEAKDAEVQVRALRAEGYDSWKRTAGAFSMLGWFADPITPSMLDGSELGLANTVLHELTHATLWVPGSAQFNESFAGFVGDEASMRWLVDRYGEADERVVKARQADEDRKAYAGLLHDVYQELERLYKSDRPRFDKLREKQRVYASLPMRVAALNLHEGPKYVKSVRSGTWNNARMVQFRTYNRNPERFAAVLEQQDGDLRAFIDRIGEITADGEDPYAALREAAGIDQESDTDSP